MRRFGAVAAAVLLAGAAQAADYVTVRRTIAVNADAQAAWARIGGFCDITKLLAVPCTIASGSGDVGTVRSLADGATLEPMVAKTPLSYTYGQTKGGNAALFYHGTLAVEPAGRGRSTIVYTLIYDQSSLPDDAARAEKRRTIETRFQGAVEKAKAVAEGK
jgi:hypothetical protein